MKRLDPERPFFIRGQGEDEAWDEVFSSVVGWLAAIAFIGGWIYEVRELGWYLGLPLGWIPPLITAFILYFLVFYIVYFLLRIIQEIFQR